MELKCCWHSFWPIHVHFKNSKAMKGYVKLIVENVQSNVFPSSVVLLGSPESKMPPAWREETGWNHRYFPAWPWRHSKPNGLVPSRAIWGLFCLLHLRFSSVQHLFSLHRTVPLGRTHGSSFPYPLTYSFYSGNLMSQANTTDLSRWL